MSEESKLLICRNNHCTGDVSGGGMIFQYEAGKAQTLQCPTCKSEYIIGKDGITYFKAVEEKKDEYVIESMKAYEDFSFQYENYRIYFPKLIIKNIEEPSFDNRILSFSKCIIDELIIEDIDITSAFYPISLSECKIGSIKISNCKIKNAGKKDYYSPWSFFGINMVRNQVSENFMIENLEANIMISDCQIDCPIMVSGRSIVEFAFLHNHTDPVIKTDNKSSVKSLFDVVGRDAAKSEKKVKTTGKTIKGITIDELHIDPDNGEKTTIENCAIHKLIFPQDGEVRSELLFINCDIGSALNQAQGFSKNIVFLGCSFRDELKFSRSSFKQSLVLEACQFNKNAVFNDLKIENDLHLSYSSVKEDLSISLVTCRAYFVSHFVFAAGGIKLNNNIFGRDVNFRNIFTLGDIVLKNNEINGDFFINRVKSVGNIAINWLKSNEMDMNDVIADKSLTIDNVQVKGDLRLKALEIKGDFGINFARMNGEFFCTRSIFHQEFSMIGCESKMSFAISNDYHGKSSFSGNIMNNTTQMQRCLYQASLSWDFLQATDINFNDNIVFNDYEVKNVKANNLNFNDNMVLDKFELDNSKANNLNFYTNQVFEACSIKNTEANDITFQDNQFHKTFELNNAEADDIYVLGNKATESLEIIYTEADDLSFKTNETEKLEIRSGNYAQITIADCEKIGSFVFNNVLTVKDVTIRENTFLKDVAILYCKINNDLELLNNEYQGEFSFHNNTITGSLDFSDKLIEKAFRFRKNLVLGSVFMKNIEFRYSFLIEENTMEQMFEVEALRLNTISDIDILKNKFNFVSFGWIGIDSPLYFDHNLVQGSLNIGKEELHQGYEGIIFSKSVSMSRNRIRTAVFSNSCFESSICLQNNHFEAGLLMLDTDFEKAMDFTGSYIGGSIIFKKIRYGGDDGDLILDQTYVDKRISFTNTFPLSFSFKNANFNSFEIPRYWQMKNGKLINRYSKKEKQYVLKENILQNTDHEKANLPYSLIKSNFETIKVFDAVPTIWRNLQWLIFPNEAKSKILMDNIERGSEVLDYRYRIDECISRTFLPVYYGFYSKELIDYLADLAYYFATTEKTYEDEETKEIFDKLKNFFNGFLFALRFFEGHTVFWGGGNDKKYLSIYKNEINDSLQEQYKVLRQIYGNDGELSNEDRAYYQWMHFRNIGEMNNAPLRYKPVNWMKYVLFEKIFGWGVNLPRILASTGGLVAVFAVIYWLMFQYNPALTISWDGGMIVGADIGFIKSMVLALQTTFSAVLGDWAPIGSGAIKIPMTINAVLGILFVTFLIGAYGRKMLR